MHAGRFSFTIDLAFFTMSPIFITLVWMFVLYLCFLSFYFPKDVTQENSHPLSTSLNKGAYLRVYEYTALTLLDKTSYIKQGGKQRANTHEKTQVITVIDPCFEHMSIRVILSIYFCKHDIKTNIGFLADGIKLKYCYLLVFIRRNGERVVLFVWKEIYQNTVGK